MLAWIFPLFQIFKATKKLISQVGDKRIGEAGVNYFRFEGNTFMENGVESLEDLQQVHENIRGKIIDTILIKAEEFAKTRGVGDFVNFQDGTFEIIENNQKQSFNQERLRQLNDQELGRAWSIIRNFEDKFLMRYQRFPEKAEKTDEYRKKYQYFVATKKLVNRFKSQKTKIGEEGDGFYQIPTGTYRYNDLDNYSIRELQANYAQVR